MYQKKQHVIAIVCVLIATRLPDQSFFVFCDLWVVCQLFVVFVTRGSRLSPTLEPRCYLVILPSWVTGRDGCLLNHAPHPFLPPEVGCVNSVAHTGLKLMPQPLKFWDYRCEVLHAVPKSFVRILGFSRV